MSTEDALNTQLKITKRRDALAAHGQTCMISKFRGFPDAQDQTALRDPVRSQRRPDLGHSMSGESKQEGELPSILKRENWTPWSIEALTLSGLRKVRPRRLAHAAGPSQASMGAFLTLCV